MYIACRVDNTRSAHNNKIRSTKQWIHLKSIHELHSYIDINATFCSRDTHTILWRMVCFRQQKWRWFKFVFGSIRLFFFLCSPFHSHSIVRVFFLLGSILGRCICICVNIIIVRCFYFLSLLLLCVVTGRISTNWFWVFFRVFRAVVIDICVVFFKFFYDCALHLVPAECESFFFLPCSSWHCRSQPPQRPSYFTFIVVAFSNELRSIHIEFPF